MSTIAWSAQLQAKITRQTTVNKIELCHLPLKSSNSKVVLFWWVSHWAKVCMELKGQLKNRDEETYIENLNNWQIKWRKYSFHLDFQAGLVSQLWEVGSRYTSSLGQVKRMACSSTQVNQSYKPIQSQLFWESDRWLALLHRWTHSQPQSQIS